MLLQQTERKPQNNTHKNAHKRDKPALVQENCGNELIACPHILQAFDIFLFLQDKYRERPHNVANGNKHNKRHDEKSNPFLYLEHLKRCFLLLVFVFYPKTVANVFLYLRFNPFYRNPLG